MTTQTATPNDTQTLEQSLNKTDMGHFIFEHRKSFIAALLIVFIGAVGFMIYKQTKQSAQLKMASELFSFEQNVVKNFNEGKITSDELMKQFNQLSKELKANSYLVPITLASAKKLNEKGQSAQALELVKEMTTYHKSGIGMIYLSHQLATLAEDQGQLDQALSTLNNLAKSGEKVLLSKTFLDLGRLEMKKGNKDQALKYFSSLIKDFPNDELAKVAKIYMTEIQ
jgi:predicted negative regulator of RcsB-dependent stress response